MSIDAINSQSQSSINASTVYENPKGTLDKDGFLKLLVTQLKYQDPLNPLDNDQFIQENTMFSQLEQMTNANTELGNLSDKLTGNDKGYAVNYLGKYIATGSESINLNSSGADPITYNLPENAQVNASIVDSDGKNIANIDLGVQNAGKQTFKWNGKDNNGNYATYGEYSVSLSAQDSSGRTIPIERNAGKVVSVQFNDGGATLITDTGSQINIKDVDSVFGG